MDVTYEEMDEGFMINNLYFRNPFSFCKYTWRAMKKVLILSDIHGNLSALNQVLKAEPLTEFAGVILLGDLIDYGPRSNEVVRRLKAIPKRQLLVNIWGNHEHAILSGNFDRFSSERGKLCAAYTQKNLTDETMEFLNGSMEKSGKCEFELYGKHCLAVHGSLDDFYWKSISHGEADEAYAKYDIVFSGHSHIPHFFEHFYACDNEAYRNKKKTIFINPGSVGQPRNHNSNAHYAVLELETMSVQMKTAVYDIEYETGLFSDEVDSFYRERLRRGV